MITSEELHRQAMDSADLAFAARLKNDFKKANELFQRAYQLESEAAFALVNSNLEPTRSVLFRSAATLALDCQQPREARRLAIAGLKGEPPPELKLELWEILDQVDLLLGTAHDRKLHQIVAESGSPKLTRRESVHLYESPQLAAEHRLALALASPRSEYQSAGFRLKSERERLNLRFRDVEEASYRIAALRRNDEFCIAISRLADIENKGVVPSIFRLYSLCAIYRMDLSEVLSWYGITLTDVPTNPLNTLVDGGTVDSSPSPLWVPGSEVDLARTALVSRVIEKWGNLPLKLLQGLDLKHHSYGYIGTEDWTMYPILQPGSFVIVDEERRKVVQSGWVNEFERPIYFVEHREGFLCGWCTIEGNQFILQPHPASGSEAQIFAVPDIEVVGQVTGVAMLLDRGRRRRGDLT